MRPSTDPSPVLDARLDAALQLIRTEVHADLGTDHAHLPIRLVQTERVRRCIAVELNPGPLEHARRQVRAAGLEAQIEVRPGDGFAPLHPGEVQSASATGLGAATILGMLERAGERLPPALVLQPNDSPAPLRAWARAHSFHVTAEVLAPGFWSYPVLRLERRAGEDPAYLGLPPNASLRYGPLLLRAGGTLVRRAVWEDVVRLIPLAAPGRPAALELAAAQEALAVLRLDGQEDNQ